MEGEWRERLVQEDGPGWAAHGCDFLLAAETVDRRRVQGMAIRGLGLVHAYVREKQLMSQQFSAGVTEITRPHRHCQWWGGCRLSAHRVQRADNIGMPGKDLGTDTTMGRTGQQDGTLRLIRAGRREEPCAGTCSPG